MTRKFEIEYTVFATLELEDSVINIVDDAWRKELYNLKTPEEIAEMIGRNMIKGAELYNLDGWATFSARDARLTIDDEQTEVEEIT